MPSTVIQLHESKGKLGRGGFGWKAKAQPPGLVDQPSDYLTYVPVRRRNPRLARVQRGLLRLHRTIPSRVGVVLPFLLPCSIQTHTRQRLILTRSPINLDLFRCFGGGGPSHLLRTNLSFFSCPCSGMAKVQRSELWHPVIPIFPQLCHSKTGFPENVGIDGMEVAP